MAHSKRNTSLAFFTAHERGLLKSTWGSQATRLTRDSFLPFGSCRLCLLPSRSPVACASNGDIFCRECAMNNLLAQRKEIKRLEKDEARRRQEEADAEARTEEEARARAVQDFERVQTGVSLKLGGPAGKRKVVGREGGKVMVEEDNEADEKAGAPKGTKRKFELDEAELLRIARDERGKARKALDDERYAAARTTLPSFWVPSLTPSLSNADAGLHQSARTHKHLPTCPGSSKARPHTYTLKTLVTVQFSEEDGDGDEGPTRICPSCKKALSNSTKAMRAYPSVSAHLPRPPGG
ncbi:MAG: hypothetical protein M1832_006024 [Thelocarpon impressellum]|nr:MAG: hypothetical protein M1832_006024 [Thelocarpon impressellum]